MTATAKKYLGRRLPRWEDRRLVTGQGKYTDDIRLPGTLHVAFVRSPHAHAIIKAIRTDGAKAHPQAVAVITGDDLAQMMEPFWSGLQRGPFRKYALYPLSRGKVRQVGEAVVAVVAESRYAAEDIAELIEVEYEPLPPVTNVEQAAAQDASLLYEEWGDNIYSHQTFTTAEVDEAFDRAHLVVRRRFQTPRVTAAPMEGRGCVAHYEPDGRLTVWVGHQDIHMFRFIIAELLRLPLPSVRVIHPDCGGAFGIKLPVYPEEMVVCALAVKLGRPVKWIQDRREGLLCDTHAREVTVDAEMAFDQDGRILGLQVNALSDAGSYAIAGRGPAIEGGMLVREMPGAWNLPQYRYDLKVVMTNKAPIAVYRGVAIPNSTFIMERLLAAGARQLGLDTVEIRRRNMVKEFPHTTVTGHVYDTGSYIEAMDTALELVKYEELKSEIAAMRAAGRKVGIGLCTLNDASTRSGGFYGKLGLPASSQEGCVLTVDPAGYVTARLGTTVQGQGLHTALAQLIADELSVPMEKIRVEMGDTLTTPHGGGAWASRGATAGGSATLLACQKMKEKLLGIGAFMLQVPGDTVELADGGVRVKADPECRVSVVDIARQAYFIPGEIPPGMEPGLTVVGAWEPTIPATFSNATHICVIEVLPETGALQILKYLVVEDCGVIINLGNVDGQIVGAVAQGLGNAVYEQLIYDENGQLITGTFVDYLLPTATEMPDIEIHHLETPSDRNPGGFKGVAEAGTVGAPSAIANAVADALDVEITSLPLSPERVLALLDVSQK